MTTTTRSSESDLVPSRSPRSALPPGRARTSRADAVHRNAIAVVGDLVSPVEPRIRGDGVEVLTFRVSVRVPAVDVGNAGTTVERRDSGSTPRRDVLDCVVTAPALRRRLEQYQPGDVLEVDGALRHRFWNASGRVQSRYEIDVLRLKRLARDRTVKAMPAADAPE